MSGFSDNLSELKSKGQYHILNKPSVSMSNTLNKPEFNTGIKHCVCGSGMIANKLQYSVSITLLTLFVCRTICSRAYTAVLRLEMSEKETE